MSVRSAALRWLVIAGLGAGLNLGVPAFSTGQEDVGGLLRQTERGMAAAREARAELLAPRTFADGMRRYEEATRDLERGRRPEDVQRKLQSAAQYFEQAVELAQLAYPILAAALEARDDAETAEAPRVSAELWRRGVDRFEQAAREMEGGDVSDARRRAEDAESLFRQSELESIKATYLQDTWDLLAQARESKVDERAPRTFARAEELVREAESLLGASRYDTDQPRALAREAKREAEHAAYLAGIVLGIEEDERTFEDVLLAAEDELRKIAATMNISPTFEAGLSETTETIVWQSESYQDDIRRLERQVADREEEKAGLQARIAELEEQLGGLAEERTALVQRMEEQARMRQKFATVERMFAREEARVMREGSDVIIRLLGLTFPVGESIIDPQYHDLLNELLRAIQEFPGSRVTVEGHTDSFGSAPRNQALSQERADAVARYILDSMRMDASLIDAIGYGEARPIASNDTREGRAQNRRIEVIIHTNIGMGY
jgi:OOP family OmpA-OmpF porin